MQQAATITVDIFIGLLGNNVLASLPYTSNQKGDEYAKYNNDDDKNKSF
jgi:hypothetical protein